MGVVRQQLSKRSPLPSPDKPVLMIEYGSAEGRNICGNDEAPLQAPRVASSIQSFGDSEKYQNSISATKCTNIGRGLNRRENSNGKTNGPM